MGLFRVDPATFYAATSEAGVIRDRKEAILRAPGSGRYLLETAEGSRAFEEFAGIAGCDPSVTATDLDDEMRNRAATLALEPDLDAGGAAGSAVGVGKRVLSDTLDARGERDAPVV